MSSADETKEGTEEFEVATSFIEAQADFEARLKEYYAQRAEKAKELAEQIFKIMEGLGDVAEVSVSYEGSGDSGDFYWDGGADGEGNSNAIVQEDDRETVMRCAICLVSLYHGGWENNEGGGGTVTFRVRSIDIDHHYYIQETEYESRTIHNPKYEIEDEVSQIDAVNELDDDGTLGFTVVRVIETPLNVIYDQEMLRREIFDNTMINGLHDFLQRHNTFLALRCYTPTHNDGDPRVNVFEFCRFGPGGQVRNWNDVIPSYDEDEEDEERPKVVELELTEADEQIADALLSWVLDELACLAKHLEANVVTNVTLFVRVQAGEWVYEREDYDCGY